MGSAKPNTLNKIPNPKPFLKKLPKFQFLFFINNPLSFYGNKYTTKNIQKRNIT
jgi:hypothetical protein